MLQDVAVEQRGVQLSSRKEGINVIALACVSPILPGREEAWRRFCQVLLGPYRNEYENFQRRLGISRETVWLAQALQGEIAIVYLEVEHPEQLLPDLSASELPFDCWFREQLLELHGIDLAQQLARLPSELVFAWHAAS